MKLKALFLTFNIVLLLSFLTIILIPMFILDGSFMLDFWAKNWYVIAVFVLILAWVNAMFFANWKVLSYLENEDWPGLSQYLEKKVFAGKRYSRRHIQLLCDSLLLLGDFATIRRLREAISRDRPALLPVLAVRFAASCLLDKNYAGVRELADRAADAKGADRDWLAFYGAFSRYIVKEYGPAADGLMPLAASAGDPLVAALSGYLCGTSLAGALPARARELDQAASGAKHRLDASVAAKKWRVFVEDAKADMQYVVVAKLLDEAGAWLYGSA